MSVKIPYRRELEFEYGKLELIAPKIRRVIANNPSPFTHFGTGTYVIGEESVAVIDPGPDDPKHIEALIDGLGDDSITHIFVTHTHMDHSPGCRLLKKYTNAETYGFGPHGFGRQLSDEEVEEGGDKNFNPDHLLEHGQIVEGEGWSIECVHTPGHTSNHMCYQYIEGRALFTGDHVMGWSTSIISPPDGDMSSYMNSLKLLLDRNDEIYWPTHGPCITDTQSHVEAFIAHREEREKQILRCVKTEGVRRIEEMVPKIYLDTPEFLYPAAARSVLAAIEYLVDKKELSTADPISLDAEYF